METQELAVQKTSYPETGLIVIRAYSNKQLSLPLRPCQDRSGRVFTGQGQTGHYETLSSEDKKSMSYIVTPETVVTLSDGKIFDLNDPIDKINWAWVRRHPYLSVDENEGKKSRDARFYVDNPVAKAEKRVKSAKIKDKVRYEIQYNMDRNKLLRAAKLLGDLGADAKSDLALQDSLLMLADVNPEMVDGAVFIKDTNMANAKMLFVEMMKYKLIQRGDGGVFRYGGEKGAPLGHTEELVIGFMLDEKNVDTLQMMKNSLAERKQVPVK